MANDIYKCEIPADRADDECWAAMFDEESFTRILIHVPEHIRTCDQTRFTLEISQAVRNIMCRFGCHDYKYLTRKQVSDD